MSVRRLAELQPATFDFTPENADWCAKEVTKYPEGRQASAIIPILWRAQKQNDYWLPKPAIEKVAGMLDMPYIRALEVATFYTMFNLSPVGRYFIQFCGTTPCVLAGADAIKGILERRIGPQRHVTADKMFSWLEVECLGACCNAPMVQINDDYYEDLTAENFAKLLDDLAAGRAVKPGSQTGRNTSEPAGGLTSLVTLYGADGRSPPKKPDPAAPRRHDHEAARAEVAAQDAVEAEPAAARAKTDREQRAAKPTTSIEDTGPGRTDISTSGAGKTGQAEAGAAAQKLGGLQQGQPSGSPGVEPGPEKN